MTALTSQHPMALRKKRPKGRRRSNPSRVTVGTSSPASLVAAHPFITSLNATTKTLAGNYRCDCGLCQARRGRFAFALTASLEAHRQAQTTLTSELQSRVDI